MRYNDTIKMVADILKFTCFKEKIEEILFIDAKVGLEVFFRLFEGDIAEIIFDNSEFLISLFGIEDPLPHLNIY